ncbi:MAG TPA: hypothetical protein VIW29_06880 [Polyangiaceae bacterium]
MKARSSTWKLGALRTGVSLLGLLTLGLASRSARADTLTISNPGDHPRYTFEAEPHLVLGFIEPPGYASGAGFGVGFRGSLPIMRNGFIPKLNNSVAIGFGLDFARYGAGDYCADGGDLSTCDDRERADGFNELYFPIVLQWNFFLSRNWSVFGEPGVALTYHAHEGPNDVAFNPFVFFVGGRFHFSDKIMLTMRIGYPAFSVGCSFLL